jgi:cyclopropane fatty-acyl-phospholipid synthase-like methyltransferase
MFTNEDISRYYDLSETHYRRIWKLDKSRSLHYGYWDESTKNFHEALVNINKILSETAGIKTGERVLDAGCGVGGSSVWLAKERGCKVVGISLNQRQINKATGFAIQAGLDDDVVFEQNDYNNTGYASGAFDIVWGIESICYADEKRKFLQEAHRLLKPGGRIILADFFKEKGLDEKNTRLVTQWANGWAINDFSTKEEFEEGLLSVGFTNIKILDITPNIMRSAKKLYRSWFFGIVGAKLYHFFNKNATSLGRNNVHNAWLQYKTLKKGLWKYLIVKAERN